MAFKRIPGSAPEDRLRLAAKQNIISLTPPTQDVTPEVQKREADLNILKLYKEVAGKEEDVTQQEEEDLDERLVRRRGKTRHRL